VKIHPNFSSFIGQTAAVKKLSFKIKSADTRKGIVRPLLFGGPKGIGKTEAARLFGKALRKADGSPRNLIEINSSTVKKTSFFDVLYPQIKKLGGCAIFFDECHQLDVNFVNLLLSVLNTDANPVRTVMVNGNPYEFDLREDCFLFATTEFDKIFGPLKDRLDKINFVPYTSEELGQIMLTRIPSHISIENGVLSDITKTLRGNARSAVQMAENICEHAENEDISFIGRKEWMDIRDYLNILPLGLTVDEVAVLKFLQKGPSTLRGLEAYTGQSRSAIQRDLEVTLVRLGLIKIGQERQITSHGIDILKKVETGIW
jgi:Holliday junction resolvasome RuvABC ATP-dependent DNA helicase subunit